MSKNITETVTVKLLKNHEHKAVRYTAGSEITVQPHEQEYLMKQNVIAANGSKTKGVKNV